jgi:hypothetical protein
MRKIALLLFLAPVALYSFDIPSFLRQDVNVTESQVKTATEMYEQGWRYTMPNPKSAQARWGNSDRRTTWYSGYWKNEKTSVYSNTTPKKDNFGTYVGDDKDYSGSWSSGGSPGRPDAYMFLLSKSGGPSS